MRFNGAVKVIGAAVVLSVITTASLMLYSAERNEGRGSTTLGDTANPNRVDIGVFVLKVDAATEEISAQVQVVPQGAVADAESGLLAHDLTVYTNGIKGDTLTFKAGKLPSVADLKVGLNGEDSNGVITDYPFDSYKADFVFAAESDGKAVPVNVTIASSDSFFRLKPGKSKVDDDVLSFSAAAERSTGTFMFALFIMVFMWFLCLAAVIAAVFAISGKRGLLWPSLSFMGALLFALIPLRNAVPGAPPIGSVIDFGAFFIAEALISLSLISTVIVGFRTERKNEKDKDTEPTTPPLPPSPAPEPVPMAGVPAWHASAPNLAERWPGTPNR
nr:DUF4436 family protein [Kibdelosporangium sp. MJ126-NF4]CEL19359.1 Possible membrane protein [Kibdelosporangium sp. MJ126-NF4]CTQ94842.1 Possible membrane protein [Kibdelosporangium sp. MJ126-NF4]